MLSSRERVLKALNHQEADRLPLDLGGGPTSGMHASSVYILRQALGLDAPGTPVKVIEPFQMLGEIAPDLIEALGVDVIGLSGPRTFFGFKNEGWKAWTTFDGTPVLVPAAFNTQPEPNGDILLYPEGDHSAPASGRMPAGGWYFDAIIRQPPIDDDNLNVADNWRSSALSPMRIWRFMRPRPSASTPRPIKRSSVISAARPSVTLQWFRRPRSSTPKGSGMWPSGT